MITALYVLCFVVSLACAVLLLRSWLRTRVPLLLWATIGFSGIALNNFLVVIDASVAADLSSWRSVPALAGLLVFIWGLAGDRS